MIQKQSRKCNELYIHCLLSNGERCPRPFGETLRVIRSNEIFHFDFLSMPKGINSFCYVLILKDGISGFSEFVPTTTATTEVIVHALLEWVKRHGIVLWWVSDQGSRFKNKVMRRLRKILGANKYFVTADSPWVKGTVEVMNRHLLKAIRSILSNRKLTIDNCPRLLSLCQSSLNRLPSSCLGGVTPITAFAASPATYQISVIY